jgi:hypothetical protein
MRKQSLLAFKTFNVLHELLTLLLLCSTWVKLENLDWIPRGNYGNYVYQDPNVKDADIRKC